MSVRAAPPDSGLAVILPIPKALADQLALADVDGATPADEMHVTLAYLGKVQDLPTGAAALMEAVVADCAKAHPPVAGLVSGWGRFNASASSEGRDVIHLSFDSPGLADLRADLVRRLDDVGLPIKRDHGFDPHITLAYVQAGRPVQLEVDTFPVTCGEIHATAWSAMFRLASAYALAGAVAKRADDPVPVGKPFAGFTDFADCVAGNQDKDDPEAFCAWLQTQAGEKTKATFTTTDLASGGRIAPQQGLKPAGHARGGKPYWLPSEVPDEDKERLAKMLDTNRDQAMTHLDQMAKAMAGDTSDRCAFCNGVGHYTYTWGDRGARMLTCAPHRDMAHRITHWFQTAATEYRWPEKDALPSTVPDPAEEDQRIQPGPGAGHAIPEGDEEEGVSMAKAAPAAAAAAGPKQATAMRVIKALQEQRYTLSVAYPANQIDAHKDFATAAQVEETAWEYAKGGRKIGLMHRKGTDGAGTVVESYIYRGPDWHIGGETVKAGDWLLGVIWSENAWNMIKGGAYTGLSIQGYARKKAAAARQSAA